MSQSSSTRRTSRRRFGAVLTGGLLVVGLGVGAVAGSASAKEVGSGGGGGGTTATCNPVTSLTYKGDARVGETGLASIDVSYGVKPCDSAQSVVVTTKVAQLTNPANVVWDDPAAPQNGRFTVFGTTTRTSYLVTVSVYDASTGVLAGTRSITAAAIPKGV
ncbi:MAG: hypothetical protein U0Q03_01190 [Acidimicrobiales bacterium]